MRRLLFILLCCYTVRASATTIVVTVGQGGNFFSPAFFTVSPGDTITWVWAGGHHNTLPMSRPTGAANWSSNIDATTTSYSYVTQVSGLYKYTCTHHSGMDAQFFVTGCNYPAKPVVTAYPKATFCDGDSIVLRVTSQGGVKYTWLDGLFFIHGAVDDSIVIKKAGNYKVVVNRCGVDSVSDAINIIINALPQPSFSYTNTGLSYSFINTTPSIGNNNYSWTFSDGSPTQQNINANHTFAAPGNYTITLKAEDKTSLCNDTTSTMARADVGVGTIGKTFFSFYPNPSSSFLKLQCASKSIIRLKDLYGHNMIHPVSVDGVYIIDVSAFSAGVYSLDITNEWGRLTEKVVIIH